MVRTSVGRSRVRCRNDGIFDRSTHTAVVILAFVIMMQDIT